MIEMKGVSKKFDQIQALTQVSGVIREGSVFGLVGTNGAGKSTCLRIMAGILKADEGSMLVDGQEVFENEEMKREVFFISDDQYYFPNATPKEMMEYYRMFYPCFDEKRFEELIKKFGLDMRRRLNTFSKGMKKQVSVLLGICANTKYLLCDETFDGLDPVMRQAVKSIFAMEIMNRDFTPIIASHNLRELEDICDHVGLLHKGGILLSKDLEEMKSNIQKVQCVVSEEGKMELYKELEILQTEQRGSLLTLTVRGERKKTEEVIKGKNPVFYEILPLTLEEIFISETEVVGYDIKSLLL
ncbi:MAG: ABC transporter ATP-binding protein [Oliverpabstia sp.]|nr:ABC transporter ATP-binding protein [Oliverpabstia sp.]